MIEYPQLIASMRDTFQCQNITTGEEIHLGWDLHYVSQGTYQARIITDQGNSLHNRNITLEMILSDLPMTSTRGNFYMTATASYIDCAAVLPITEDLKLMLAIYVHSNPYYTDGRDLDFCEDDNCEAAMPLHRDQDHGFCNECHAMFAVALMSNFFIQDEDNGEEILYLCLDCTNNGVLITDDGNIETCGQCLDFYVGTSIGWHRRIGQGQVLMCEECVNECYQCYDCGALGDMDDMIEDEMGDYRCGDCSPDTNDSLVEDWNYLPDLIFHPSIPINPLKPLYIGMELEINWENWKYEPDANEWLEAVKSEHSDIMFVKGDSSVHDGFELVTHPMSPDWALENFPFYVLEDAVSLGASERHRSTGIHIHIDRGALTTAQLWKILKVHEKQRELCGIIGGRGTKSDYASWDNNYECVGERALEIARAKGEAWGGSDRYVPINLKNENTIELRYMEGSIAVPDLKKNIEWVQALYDFTDHISVEDVKKGVLDIPGFLLGWIVDQEKIYPNLTGFVLKRTMIPLEMPTRSASCV